jgi:hypothetical protein
VTVIFAFVALGVVSSATAQIYYEIEAGKKTTVWSWISVASCLSTGIAASIHDPSQWNYTETQHMAVQGDVTYGPGANFVLHSLAVALLCGIAVWVSGRIFRNVILHGNGPACVVVGAIALATPALTFVNGLGEPGQEFFSGVGMREIVLPLVGSAALATLAVLRFRTWSVVALAACAVVVTVDLASRPAAPFGVGLPDLVFLAGAIAAILGLAISDGWSQTKNVDSGHLLGVGANVAATGAVVAAFAYFFLVLWTFKTISIYTFNNGPDSALTYETWRLVIPLLLAVALSGRAWSRRRVASLVLGALMLATSWLPNKIYDGHLEDWGLWLGLGLVVLGLASMPWWQPRDVEPVS